MADSAGHIIHCADILNLFADDFAHAIVGEEVNGKLLSLIATSRLFTKPMSAAIKGTSAGGKSEIRKQVLEFFPPESVVSFTSLSEKSLIYYDGDFSHKVLSMGEAVATDEQVFQDYLLRELISEGRLRHSTVQKVGNDLVNVTIEKDGPVAFLVTTTKNKLHPENETRMVSIEIDDSPDQTRKVLDKVASVDGMHDAAVVDYAPWQDFQRWLELGECRVVVPFAKVMAGLMPAAAVRLRRDIGQVIRAIKAHALLHRDQRNHDDAGRILADIENDYAAVRGLMNSALAESAGVAINPAITETIEAIANATIGMTEAEGANAKTIAKLLKLDQSATWRRLSAACSEGYVVNLESRERMPGKYRLTSQKPEGADILPTVTGLAQHYAAPAFSEKTVHTCIREEIADISQEDECMQADGNLSQSAKSLHTLKSLNGNENSPPYARMQGFSEKHGEESRNGGARAFRSDVEDAHEELRERGLTVCAHCGGLGGGDVLPFAYGELSADLHPRCRHDWLLARGFDLSIPAALRRGSQ